MGKAHHLGSSQAVTGPVITNACSVSMEQVMGSSCSSNQVSTALLNAKGNTFALAILEAPGADCLGAICLEGACLQQKRASIT